LSANAHVRTELRFTCYGSSLRLRRSSLTSSKVCMWISDCTENGGSLRYITHTLRIFFNMSGLLASYPLASLPQLQAVVWVNLAPIWKESGNQIFIRLQCRVRTDRVRNVKKMHQEVERTIPPDGLDLAELLQVADWRLLKSSGRVCGNPDCTARHACTNSIRDVLRERLGWEPFPLHVGSLRERVKRVFGKVISDKRSCRRARQKAERQGLARPRASEIEVETSELKSAIVYFGEKRLRGHMIANSFDEDGTREESRS
ncbi:hypothetical protein GGX14DRAFT_469332, partial [Mycena pura]